jgi:hypothetical protein
MIDLKSLGKKKIGKKEKFPEKTSINLLINERDHSDPRYQIALFVVFLIILAVFVKFMVVDLIVDSYKAQNNYETMQAQISELQENNKDYSKIRAQYSHYGNGYLNDEERAEQSRATIMSVIDDNVLAGANIQGIDIAGNVAKVTIEGIKLKTVSGIVSRLESSSAVSYVTVATAGTNTGNSSDVTATLTVNFKEAGGDE